MGKSNVRLKRETGALTKNAEIYKTKVHSNPFSKYLIFSAPLLAVGLYMAYSGYLETRVNSPFNSEKITLQLSNEASLKFWGTYRPGSYFGIRTRSNPSLLLGLMWFFPDNIRENHLHLRHWCEHGDNLQYYSWTKHDGLNFGIQEIHDNEFKFKTSFVKRYNASHSGDWGARINISPKLGVKKQVAVFFYVYQEGNDNVQLQAEVKNQKLIAVHGYSKDLGNFQIQFNSDSEVHNFYLSTYAANANEISKAVKLGLRLYADRSKNDVYLIGLGGEIFEENDPHKPNLLVYQLSTDSLANLEVVFQSETFTKDHGFLTRNIFTNLLHSYQKQFEEKFENIFGLQKKNFSFDEIQFAQAALSNMLGGIGYFYGASLVQSHPVLYWKAPLYTAVPSRSYFPRGFLWDEGFHNLLIAQWEESISLDIIAHWLDLMNTEGWIPREQILGKEAQAKVPSEFIVQHNNIANPPALLLSIKLLVERMERRGMTAKEEKYLLAAWPRLKAWYVWLNSTQEGNIPGSYRWRGRDAVKVKELNPKTLPSGLDDYPRASHPTSDERHLDLMCWVALASRILANVANLLHYDSTPFHDTYQYLTDSELMDKLHWSASAEAYLDFGLHTDGVILRRPSVQPGDSIANINKEREVLVPPQLQYINSFGYVSLFPLLLELLPANSSRLGKLLQDIMDPKLLWTDYGLRSLSPLAPLYMKRNTEHDPPYWRGPIWININFLVVKALWHYSDIEGPYNTLAKQIYKELRENLIKNIYKEYNRTGYIWEQYNDKTGKGQGSYPFTGWSSLIVLIMAEKY